MSFKEPLISVCTGEITHKLEFRVEFPNSTLNDKTCSIILNVVEFKKRARYV